MKIVNLTYQLFRSIILLILVKDTDQLENLLVDPYKSSFAKFRKERGI